MQQHKHAHQAALVPQPAKETVYYGAIVRVPRGAATNSRLAPVAVPPELLSVQHSEPIAVALMLPIERIDSYDPATGDHLILYRVPYQRTAQELSEAECIANEMKHTLDAYRAQHPETNAVTLLQAIQALRNMFAQDGDLPW